MTPDSEREGSEREFFFLEWKEILKMLKVICLHRHGLLYSAQQLNAKGDKSGARRRALQCREDGEIGPRNFKLKTLTR